MRAAFFLIFALLASSFDAAHAQRAQGVLPLDRVLTEIRRTHPGQFYDADGPNAGADGSQHYHLKWMTPDGRVEWLDTDARTGRVLGTSPGRDSFDASPRIPVAPSGPAEAPYRGRFQSGDNGGDANGRLPGGFYQRGGRDYGNGREDNSDNRRGDSGGNRDFRGRYRQR